MRCTPELFIASWVDLRPNSPTFKNLVAALLKAEKRNMVYVPEVCGHGFLSSKGAPEVFTRCRTKLSLVKAYAECN